jgi:predicted nucleotidyltransferase
MASLSDGERDCLRRYCELLRERLGEGLIEVRLFGSAARGDMWPARSPMHSDIDLLVITHELVPDAEQEELLNETYPLYLECGRQLSPHFFSERRLAEPEDDRTREFLRRVESDLVPVWPEADDAAPVPDPPHPAAVRPRTPLRSSRRRAPDTASEDDAAGGTRTPTGVRPIAPEAIVSTNSTTAAGAFNVAARRVG